MCCVLRALRGYEAGSRSGCSRSQPVLVDLALVLTLWTAVSRAEPAWAGLSTQIEATQAQEVFRGSIDERYQAVHLSRSVGLVPMAVAGAVAEQRAAAPPAPSRGPLEAEVPGSRSRTRRRGNIVRVLGSVTVEEDETVTGDIIVVGGCTSDL